MGSCWHSFLNRPSLVYVHLIFFSQPMCRHDTESAAVVTITILFSWFSFPFISCHSNCLTCVFPQKIEPTDIGTLVLRGLPVILGDNPTDPHRACSLPCNTRNHEVQCDATHIKNLISTYGRAPCLFVLLNFISLINVVARKMYD